MVSYIHILCLYLQAISSITLHSTYKNSNYFSYNSRNWIFTKLKNNSLASRAVERLWALILGGQEHFIYLIFLYFFQICSQFPYISFLILVLQMVGSPTREGPGYASVCFHHPGHYHNLPRNLYIRPHKKTKLFLVRRFFKIWWGREVFFFFFFFLRVNEPDVPF